VPSWFHLFASFVSFAVQHSKLVMVHVPLGGGGELVEATFVARPNRFVVEALLDGALVRAHLHDRGRLKETLIPGARLLLARRAGARRATAFQAVGAYVGEQLASIDTVLPNRLIDCALRAGALAPFAGYTHVRREATVGRSRFDFMLSDAAGRRCIVEVKSAGFVDTSGEALFPDAPTERGRRHLRELAEAAAGGERVAVVFVAQGCAGRVRVNDAIDPAFAQTLAAVAADGVEVYAYSCPLSPAGITLGPCVPVWALRRIVSRSGA
jgi:sugar fermentation stimulation protein A